MKNVDQSALLELTIALDDSKAHLKGGRCSTVRITGGAAHWMVRVRHQDANSHGESHSNCHCDGYCVQYQFFQFRNLIE
jgi:hypothetical protein